MDTTRAVAAVEELLAALEVNEADHTADTPRRVVRAWQETLAGYQADPRRHLARTFTAPDDPGLVVVAGLHLVTTCAHHLLPIVGRATVAYRPAPGAPVVGLSKLSRVVADYAARLQVQERLGWQIASAVQDCLAPVGAGCVITAVHGCMTVRGVRQPTAVTTTAVWTGTWTPEHPDVEMVVAEHRAAG
ncbi:MULTISPECIES: GTP cyclohydrolase I [Frankia]|uniref:GTP cyclohydrolase 1 n=1 Tax=Frankia alni (strain DSM 45986 / CECT 9034 / ACN14a) TaxID=326424 RepID=Q0RM61_FRAAA|nr:MULTISPECIES: GTP cyclohydrolase I [Frankia]CAJ61391.1 putative GTP cyclohydrolase I (Mycobacteriophage protein Gp6) [Frankia alni ACN14a]